jgi:8-amino-7-oxononanoate synthase
VNAGWDGWVEGQLDAVRAAGRWRRLRPLEGTGPNFVDGRGRPVVSFASNDYLGLAGHPDVISAAVDAAYRYGSGAQSSRLIVGDRPVHHELESVLAEWRAAEAALVLPSGYHANLAVLGAVGAAPEATIVSDELNHASIVDGARLARAQVRVYRHGDVGHAAELVGGAAGPCVVVSDSVFSMDGDLAPVEELSRLCVESGALLVLDDAHAVLAVPAPDPRCRCIRVGTLSKALGSQGGFVTGPAAYIDLLVNRSRSMIFTTGLSPMAAAAGLAAARIIRSQEGADRLARLRATVDQVRAGHPSPIIPLVLGSEQAALAAAEELLSAGLLVPAIRPPTVAVGSSRLRISLSAAHSAKDVERLVAALESVRGEPG